ncbi:thiF family domain-containing protein [Ditylenchus destructor]|uniref:NEDD8-activating enzyme E1 regulatory subunit n=1 Tax=Ditylenchus destructor TaxID=166010 RepID=A0AAD4R7B5_9BILA|nr:thiF family domain-containing protein [Ditylenchus destructor]
MEQDSVRYDRQVRLWGEEGQQSIQQASVCVFGSSALATEILKSLVLAGVGKFRVIDDAVIGESDLGQNFFTTADDVGKSRAEIVVKNLLELNPSVKGDFVVRNFDATNLKDLLEFSTVISTNLAEKRAERLSDFLFEHGVPLVYARICGMFGYVRLCYNQHTVWNSHLENPPNDFRLDRPFEAQMKFADSMDLDAMNHEQHSHTPYLILYIKALEKWRNQQSSDVTMNGNDSLMLPDNFAKRSLDEENFNEAKTNLIKSFGSCKISENVRKVFNDPKAMARSAQSLATHSNGSLEFLRPFWVLAAAVHSFWLRHNQLPLSGVLPDMTSDSARYTQLLQIYKQKASEDAQEVFEITKEIVRERHSQLSAMLNVCSDSAAVPPSELMTKTLRMAPSDYGSRMSTSSDKNGEAGQAQDHEMCSNFSGDEEVSQPPKTFYDHVAGLPAFDITWQQCQQFCKSAAQIAVQNGVSLKEENQAGLDSLLKHIADPNLEEKPITIDCLVWFILLRAMDRFQMEKDRFPGTNGVPCGIDSKDLKRRVDTLIAETNNSELKEASQRLIPQEAIDEICRYGAAEPHVICAIVGGALAQEVIKLVTHQYLPVDNAFIFDGHSQNATAFRIEKN